jgi:CheY-like chemotaxis protein
MAVEEHGPDGVGVHGLVTSMSGGAGTAIAAPIAACKGCHARRITTCSPTARESRLSARRSARRPWYSSRRGSPPGPGEPLDASTARILVVEDDAFVRELVVAQLTSLGHEVVAVDDAEAALRALTAGAFGLLMTDVMLPGEMDGYALAQRVRDRWPELPVLYVSGGAAASVPPGAPADARVRHLRKPFRLPQLAGAVDELLAAAPTR